MSTSTKRTGGSPKDAARHQRAGAIAQAAGTAGSLRRPGAAALAAGAASLAAAPSFAQVSGEHVVSGQAAFQRQGSITTITASNNAIINYNSFNIRANETVRFVQPDSLSRVLNRINSTLPTQIDGNLSANGKVYIVNPAGVYFAKGAMINVGGIYAAAGTITNQDFLRGIDRFVTTPGGKVVNEGTIQAPVVGLVAQHVANFGTINAPEGAVMMVSGDSVLLGEYDGHVYAKIDKPQPAPEAAAGASTVPAAAPARQGRFGAGDMYSLAVWNSGSVKADKVQIEAQRGAVAVQGTIDVSNTAPGGKGGSVEVLGQAVVVQGATIDASGDAGGGQVLVGGNYQGKGPERNAERTTVTSGSNLVADAKTVGDGGTVVVWSDKATKFDGHISARGGAQGGDGGFAEISSKVNLDSNVNVDLSAPHGHAGTLLFDPAFISIEGGSADGSDNPDTSASFIQQTGNPAGTINFGDTGEDKNGDLNPDGSSAADPFKVFESELESTGANIILRATQQITTAGTFTGTAVTLTPGTSLTLETDGSTGPGVIDLTTSADGTGLLFRAQGAGGITIQSSALLNVNNITVGKLQTDNQDITIGTTNGTVTLANTVDAGTGTVRLSASGTIAQASGAVITAASIGAASGGNITLDQAANNADVFAARLTAGAGTVAYRNTDEFSVGTVTGVAGASSTGINAPGGTVKLRSDTAFITQTAPIIASTLGVRTDAAVGLNNAANDVDTFAALLAGPTGSISYVDVDGFVVGAVNDVGGTNVTGIDSGARDTSLAVGAGGTVTQTDPIVADKLTLLGAGTFDLTGSAANNIARLQAGSAPGSAVGGVTFLNSTGVQVLDGTLVTNNLDVRSATGTIAANGTIDVGGNIRFKADDIDFSSGTLSFSPGAASVLTLEPFLDATPVHIVDGTSDLHFSQNDLNKVSSFPALVVGSDTGTALLTFGGTTAFAQHITLRSGGQGGQVTLLTGSSLSTAAGKNITIKAGSNDAGNTVHGVFTQAGTAAINAGAGTLSITGDEMALGGADTIQGTGQVVLQPASPTRAIQVGGVDDPAKFSIDSTEFLALKNGFSKIVIGRDDSNAASSIASVTANDPLVFQTPAGGTMDVSSLTAGSGVALVTGGTLNVSQAFSATNAEITLKSGADLTIANNISAGTGTVRLISGGTITESPGVSITAGALGVRAAGTVSIAETGNDVGTFAAVNTLGGAKVTYVDGSAVSIGTVGAETLNNGTPYFAAASGVTTSAGDFTLGAGGNVGIGANIALGVGTARIASTGSVIWTGTGTLTDGRILASRLGVSAQGDISITHPLNQIAFVALDASGAASAAGVQVRTANGTTIDQVTADGSIFGTALGISSGSNGDVLVSTGVGGLSITQPVDAGTGTVRLTNTAGVGQSGAGVITAGALGVNTSGTVLLPLANTTPVSLTAMTFAADAVAGNILFNIPTRNLAIGTVGADGGGLFTSTAGITTTGTVRLNVAGGGVSQTARVVAGSLGIRSADAVSLTSATNDVDTLAIDVTNAAQSVAFRDTDGLTVGSVAAAAPFAQTDGIITAGDVSVRTGAGLLQIDESIDVGGSHDVRLVSGQGIAQTTTAGKGIIARTLGVNAGGDAKLLNADNDAATFAGSTTAGELKYIDKSAIDINSLAADGNGFALTNGLTTAGGDALIDAAGAITIKKNVSVGAGTLRLVSTAGISQDVATTVTAAGLGFVASGTVDLSQAGNAIASVAGTNGGPGSPVNIATTGPASVVNITFDADDGNFPSTAGVSTTNGLFTLTSTGVMNINEVIDTGTGGALLSAGGLVTVANSILADTGTGVLRITTSGGVNQTAGDIRASALGVRAGGDVTLNLVDGMSLPVNNVTTFAATTAASGGRIAYRDIDAVDLGSVAAATGFTLTSGLTTTGGAYIQTGGALTQSQAITAGALGVRANGPITLNLVDGSFNPVNNVTTFAAAGTNAGSAIVYRDSNAVAIGAVPGISGFAAVNGLTTAGDGNALVHSGGALTLADNVNVGAGTLRLVSALGVNQTGGAITAGSLGVRSAGDITLGNTANDADVFAAATGSGNILYADNDALQIGNVAASGTFTPAVNGVTASGTVSVQSGASGTGNLTFDTITPVSVSGSAITLRAGDGPGGTLGVAIVDALAGGPTFKGPSGVGAPTSFTFRQDASVADTSLPLASQFQGSVSPQAYTIISDDGGVTIGSAAKVNGTDLTLSGTSVSVPPDLQVRSLTITGPATISSVDATGTVNFNNDIVFGSSVTIEADEINFGGTVSASVPGLTLTLRQKALNRTINLGSTGSDPLDPIAGQLDLTALEISRIQSSFASILIGRPDATGLLQVLNPVTFNAPVTLDMRGTGSAINIGARLAGAAGVPITIRGNKSTTTISADIVTQGQAILIDDTVIVAGTPTLDSTGGGAVAAGANVTITGTTDADAAARSLTITAGTAGAVALQGAVGTGAHVGTQALGSLAATGATIALPVVTTTGLQSYTGVTTVGGNLTSTTGGSISFNGATTLGAPGLQIKIAGLTGDRVRFNGTVDGATALNVDVGAAGQAEFNSPVGATTALTSLTITGDTLVTASPVTFRTAGGAIGFLGDLNGPAETVTVVAGSGPVTLGGNVGVTGALSAFTINSATILGADSTINTSGATTLNGTVDGAGRALTVNAGAFSLGGSAGGSGGLGAFTINAPTTLTAAAIGVTTANAPITFNGPVGGSSTLTASAGTGAVVFGGDVGSVGSPLLGLSATGSSISLRSVNTTGAQSYNGAATVAGDLLAAGPAPITFAENVTLVGASRSIATQGGAISFQKLLDGASALTADAGTAGVTFNGLVGSQTPLAGLTATGGQIITGAGVTTTGAQAYNGTTRFGGNVAVTQSGAGVTVNGPLTVAGVTTTVSTAGQALADSIVFNGTVDGGSLLTLSAGAQGDVTVTGNLGDSIAPASLTASGRRITMNGAHTSGGQVYNGTTSLTGNLTSDTGTLRINGDAVLGNDTTTSTFTSQGAYFSSGVWLRGDSVVNAGAGQIFFRGTVETAQTVTSNPTPTGVAALANRSLTLQSILQPTLQFTGSDTNNPFQNDSEKFSAFVNAPFMFNANVGGAYQGGAAPTAAEKSRMLKTLTFDRGSAASSISPVSTIVMTKGQFNADGSGRFTIPSNFPAEGTGDASTVRILTTEGFDMGVGSKLLAVGNFFSYVDQGSGTLGAVLGDISSLANIAVVVGDKAAGSIKIRPRAGASVTSNLFTSSTPTVANASLIAGNTVSPVSLNDDAVDLVALGTIAFTVQPVLTSTGTARLATPTAATNPQAAQIDNGSGTLVPFLTVGVFNGGLLLTNFDLNPDQNPNIDITFDRTLLFPGNGIISLNGAPTAGQPFSNLTAFGLGLDLRASGAPATGNLATSIASAAGLATSISQTQLEIHETVALGANVLEDLYQLGLNVKSDKSVEYLEDRVQSLSGRTDYDDVPPYAKPDADRQDYRVSLNRLSADTVRSVLASYYDLIGEDNTTRAERKRQIQSTIGASWEKYATPIEEADGTPDGVGFRRFVEANPSEKQTLDYLDKIGALLRQIDRLALSPVELSAPKQKTLSDLRGELMSPEQLEEAALGVPASKPAAGVAFLSSVGGDTR